MAQYLPFIPDTFPEPVIYAPDFNFFDKMLQRKQLQYEQGVNQAKAAYRAVYDAPLTNQYNIPLKDQYLKQAQEGLKKIAATDLSLPQNQQVAQSLYAPFWEDSFIVKDAGLTKWYQSQAQKLESWRTSSDAKTREQYNGIVSKYLSNGLDVLRTANRDNESFSKVEKREAIPWTNIESYLEEAANKEKLTIKNDDVSGPYLVSTENGERSQKKYGIWAQSMIGNNFYQQFNVSGIVEKEERIKNIKNNPEFTRRYPNPTNKDVLNFMSEDVISELNYGFKKRQNEVDAELARVQSLIGSLPDVLDEKHERMAEALADEKKKLIAKREGINQEYKHFDQPSRDLIKSNLLINPDSYFATLAKQRLINNWATGRASIEGTTIKENTAWSNAESNQLRQAELQQKIAEHNWKKEQDMWERAHPKSTGSTIKTKTIKDANGNDVTVIDNDPNTDEKSTGSYIGLGTTDITKEAGTGVALDIFNKTQKDLFTGAYDMLFNPSGLLSLTKKEFGVNQEDISNIHTYFKREMRSNVFDPNGAEVTQTPAEARSMNKLLDKLLTNDAVKKAGFTSKKADFTGPGSFANGLNAFAADYLTKRNKGIAEGTEPPLTEDEFAALMSYDQANVNLETYHANEINRKELIKKNISSNKDYQNLIVTRSNGEKDLINADDLSNSFKEIEVVDSKTGKKEKLSSHDLALAYTNGNISLYTPSTLESIGLTNGNSFMVGYNIKANNKIYNIKGTVSANNYSYLPKGLLDFDRSIVNLNKTYKSSEEFSKIMRQAESEVIPNLLFYKDRTGKMGTQWAYNFNRKTENDKAYQLFNSALSPANGIIYDADGKEPIETEQMEKIRTMFANKEKNIEEHVGGFTYKTLTSIDGKPAIQFSIVNTEGKDKAVDAVAGTYNIALQDLNNQLGNLPQNTGHYMFGSLLRGKTVKSNPIMDASGFHYEIVPEYTREDDYSDGGVHVTLYYTTRENKINDKGVMTSELVPKTLDAKFNLKTGDNKKNPDELVQYLNSLYQTTMIGNKEAQDAYNAYLKSKVGSSQSEVKIISKAEKLKQLGIQ